nr:LOW QUALITY PROTEIN: pleckstrin homology domain-containing family G member 3 [Gasterosteus aculeatus aculeatus]
MADCSPSGRLPFTFTKRWKPPLVICSLRWHCPLVFASSRGPSAMPEGSHSALHQDPMGEESPQLSSPLSAGEHERAYSRLCVELPEGDGERPLSLASTLSSGSSRDSRSLFGSTAALPSSATPPEQSEDDIDLELSPAESGGERPAGRGRGRSQSPPPTTTSGGRWPERREPGAAQRNGDGKARFPASPVVARAMAPDPKLTYLDRVVMEIIETERMYVKDLRSIVEDYLAHIIDMSNLPIQPEQVCGLFGNIEDIYEFNSELLQSLDMCESDPVAIARCFVDKREYFDIYTQYCTNYPNSVAALTDCMGSKTLATFFQDRQAALKRSLPLGSYLLKPVQRILKYHLLLQEIAKHFDSDEEGYEVIQEAINTMTGVAWYINDMKRKHEHAVRVQEIQSLLINWKGPDLTTYGELVLEGTFHVLRAKNTRTLFLFERMLLITKKRGEHYVYKTHISCSTLMLLDSAKDPLLFSVIHFKHPKQPHTVQAKSVEEKRLWAHQIKRLILENHNTIIPQQAKEAIMDHSMYPGKYHYSPERLKKAESFQGDDFHLAGRNGRRRSEPAKHTILGTKAVLKHADSEGALLGERCSLRPAASDSTQAPALSQAPSERPCAKDLNPGGPTDRDPRPEPRPSEGGLQPDTPEEEKGESYKEDVLMGDDQVADFASSVLAAISCWHYRARALLSTRFTTDDQIGDTAQLTITTTEEVRPPAQEEKQVDVAVNETKVGVAEPCPLDRVPQERQSRRPESPVCPVQQGADTPESHDDSRETAEEEEEEEGESDSSGHQAEETSVLTNGELSEEEEEALSGNASILPSSVLDQASVIAERFIGGLSRRSSLVSEDLGSPACPSPSIENDIFKSPSACVDLEQQTQTPARSPPEPKVIGEAVPSTPAPALAPNGRAEEEPGSTLSKRDRLLIRKIRRYYQHAENEDASFSIKRRESLSYIPAGLVRHLSRQLNSVPQEQAAPAQRKGLSRNRPTSWSVFDLPGLEKIPSPGAQPQTKPQRPVEAKARSQSITDATTTDEEFRDSSDMLKVWQDMEMEADRRDVRRITEETLSDPRLEATWDLGSGTPDVKTSKNPPPLSEESDGCAVSSPTTAFPPAEGGSCPDSTSPDKLPKLISFRSSIDEDQILQDMGKMKNKVFQLARQYSQRIKSNRPIVWPRNRERANPPSFKSLPAVREERIQCRKKGKPDLRLPLNTCDHSVVHEERSPSPVQTPGSGPGSEPGSPETDGFCWPAVHELRTKYTDSGHSPNGTPACAVPNGTPECCARQDGSSSDLRGAPPDGPSAALEDRCRVEEEEDRAAPRVQPLLCRWSSLDHVLGSLPLHEAQSFQEPVRSSFTTSQVSLITRGGDRDPDCTAKAAAPAPGKTTESNLVKSLREKFQSLTASS